jgi:hypothetical protein
MTDQDADRTRAEPVAAQIDAIAASNPSWMHFVLALRSSFGGSPLDEPVDAEATTTGADPQTNDQAADAVDNDFAAGGPAAGGQAVDDPVEQAAVFACSYVVAFEDGRGRAQFSVKPFFESDDYSWPLLPREVDPEIAVWWPVLADLVQSPAP